MKIPPNKAFSVIVTIGPSTLVNPSMLREIDCLGPCIYRINGAHVDSTRVQSTVATIRSVIPYASIMIDLPGNKIRTTGLSSPLVLRKDSRFCLCAQQTTYPPLVGLLNQGDIILARDSTIRLEVTKVENDNITLVSHSEGVLENGKGLHIPGITSSLPFLFKKDSELIRAAGELDLDYISLSYVRTAEDIRMIRRELDALGNNTIDLFIKIETAAAVSGLSDILKEASLFNIDRGDLSAEIGLLALPGVLDNIIDSVLSENKQLFVATQFLKNMEINPIPSISEICDLASVMAKGIIGIQLSDETAIGRYPVESVRMLFDASHQFKSCTKTKHTSC